MPKAGAGGLFFRSNFFPGFLNSFFPLLSIKNNPTFALSLENLSYWSPSDRKKSVSSESPNNETNLPFLNL
jgi:hypothetical protein